jgi:serine protease Do
MPAHSSRLLFSIIAFSLFSTFAYSQSREEKVLGDKLKFEKDGLWYYNDLDKAFETAQKTQQPVLAVLRCIPCEECVKLDEDLMEENPVLQRLLRSFVRVRIVGCNGLDLSLFEFDTDQSFAVFIFNPDKTLYTRYGTRSDRKAWEDDVSIEGMIKTLEAALRVHREYPASRQQLVGKQAKPPVFPTPEKIQSLSEKFSGQINYQENTVKSCIHCHMIGDALREHYRKVDQKFPEQFTYPYPHPKIIGAIFDPAETNLIKELIANSPAAAAGLQVGDRIQKLEGQSMLSIADVQWVLHHSPNQGSRLSATIERNNQVRDIEINLPSNWKNLDNISWRASSWPLRRIGLGGLALKEADDNERSQAGIAKDHMALTVQHVGAFAPHDRAKKAGMLKGDIIIEYDGRRDLLRDSDLLVYSTNEVPPGKQVKLRFVRDGKEREATISTAP